MLISLGENLVTSGLHSCFSKLVEKLDITEKNNKPHNKSITNEAIIPYNRNFFF